MSTRKQRLAARRNRAYEGRKRLVRYDSLVAYADGLPTEAPKVESA